MSIDRPGPDAVPAGVPRPTPSNGAAAAAVTTALGRLRPDAPAVALVRDVRPWGGPRVDLHLEAGRVAAVVPHDAAAPVLAGPQDVVEGGGALALPAFSDVHVHLDSNRLGLPFRPHTGGPGVEAMMLNDRAHWREDGPAGPRVERALGLLVARGVTHLRTYAQVDVDAGLERLEAVLAAREAFAGVAEVEVVAFPQAGLLREKGGVDVLAAAMRRGADVVGGIDPCQLDRDPVRHLDAVFDLAVRHGAAVDVHLHEQGSLGAFTLELIAERTRALGLQGRVTVAHAFVLGTVPPERRAELVGLLAELDIAVTTVAPAGSGVLPLRELVAAGVRVGLGQDGQRDFWSPYGNGDLLDRAWQLAFTNGFRRDDDIVRCLEVATLGGRSVLDAAAPRVGRSADGRDGLSPGDPADLVLIDSEGLVPAVMDRPQDRVVLHRGRLVAAGAVPPGR